MSRGLLIVRIAGALVVVAATIIALDWFVAIPLRCSRAASAGAAQLDYAGDAVDESTSKLMRRIGVSLQGCDCVTPPDARIFLVRGAVEQGGGDLHSAIADYRRALEIDRRPEIYLRLGLAQLAASDRPAALESLVRACAFDPARLPTLDDDTRREVKGVIRARYGERWVGRQ